VLLGGVEGEEGRGSERVPGFIPNTRILETMMAANGWKR